MDSKKPISSAAFASIPAERETVPVEKRTGTCKPPDSSYETHMRKWKKIQGKQEKM
jgi:hypothetical protein